MSLDEFYKLVKDILQIEREEKDFPSHLNILLGAYLETYRDLDDSYFKIRGRFFDPFCNNVTIK